MLYTKETLWRSMHGIVKKLKDLDDSHIANLINFASYYGHYHESLLEVLEEIRLERGLKQEYLDRSQIPYKNPNGNWEIWDFEEECLLELSK